MIYSGRTNTTSCNLVASLVRTPYPLATPKETRYPNLLQQLTCSNTLITFYNECSTWILICLNLSPETTCLEGPSPETDLRSLITLATIVFPTLQITRGLKIFWETGPIYVWFWVGPFRPGTAVLGPLLVHVLGPVHSKMLLLETSSLTTMIFIMLLRTVLDFKIFVEPSPLWALTGEVRSPSADLHSSVAPHRSISVPSRSMLSSDSTCNTHKWQQVRLEDQIITMPIFLQVELYHMLCEDEL